jgi:hypothetical protein
MPRSLVQPPHRRSRAVAVRHLNIGDCGSECPHRSEGHPGRRPSQRTRSEPLWRTRLKMCVSGGRRQPTGSALAPAVLAAPAPAGGADRRLLARSKLQSKSLENNGFALMREARGRARGMADRLARRLQRTARRTLGLILSRGRSCRVSRRKPVRCAMPIWARVRAIMSSPPSRRNRPVHLPHCWTEGAKPRLRRNRPRRHRLRPRARSPRRTRMDTFCTLHRPMPRRARKNRLPTAPARKVTPVRPHLPH